MAPEVRDGRSQPHLNVQRTRSLSVLISTVRLVDLTPELLEPLGHHLVGSDPYASAPMPLHAAVLYLTEPQAIVASVCSAQQTEDEATWRAIWLTEEVVGFGEVSKRCPEWDAESMDQAPDASIAWIRPLRDVTQVGTHLLNWRGLGPFGRRWASDIYPTMSFKDGRTLTLPLFGDEPSRQERESIEQFAAALRSHVSY